MKPLEEMEKLDTLCMCDINEAAEETLSKLSTLKALFMWGDSNGTGEPEAVERNGGTGNPCIYNTDFFAGRN